MLTISYVRRIGYKLIEASVAQLKNRFEVVDLGEASSLLGLCIKHDEEARTMQL